MKTVILFFTVLIFNANPGWLTNYGEAQKIAKENHKFILVNFSGSDWCGPCIRLRKEIFESEAFMNFSPGHLVLVNADFPRNKKNRLAVAQVKLNELLAEKFNSEGKFPYTILLNEDGKIVKAWDGFPDMKADKFVTQITKLIGNIN